jgi:hypothetical protein
MLLKSPKLPEGSLGDLLLMVEEGEALQREL